MEFIGRTQEVEIIQHMLDKEGYQGCIIYGRRRMGKTELIKHCLLTSAAPTIIYQCKESNEQENTLLLSNLVSSSFNLPNISFTSFISCIEYIFESSKTQKINLVIDEYPYIREIIDGCDSKFQELIDKYSNNCQLKLFLLGSSISIMENILSTNNPLYQRFSQSILLQQMDYFDSAKFYPSFSNEDKVRLYSVFGGIPYYNAQIDSQENVKQNIIRIISGPFAGLKDYIEIYLKDELRKINNANAVFESIANGAFHFSDILSKSHIQLSATLNATLHKLLKMDLIEYISPINDKNNKQKAGYKINDPCVKFYYTFICKNASAHNVLNSSTFYDTFIEPYFENNYVPLAFEKICTQYLINQNKKGLTNPMLFDIGTYWYDNPKEKKNGQFDVVGKVNEGYVFFECKFTNSPIDDKIIQEEINQINKTTLKPIQYGFISRKGFKLKQVYPYIFKTLDDLYEHSKIS